MRVNQCAWRAVLCAIFAGIAIAVIQNKVIPCVDALTREFSIGLSTFGWLSSVFCVMGIIMAFPAAVIIRRLGVKKTCLFSLCCAAVGSVVGIFSRSVALLMVSRVIEGIGAGLISVAVPTLIAMWFSPERRGLPTGIWSSWQFVAQAVCFFWGVGATESFGWRGVWCGGILISAAALLLCLLWLKPPSIGEGFFEAEKQETPTSIAEGLRVPSAWMASGAMFCFCFACFGFVSWAAACWTEQFGISLDLANRYVSLFALISLPVVVVVGFLMDRTDRKRFSVLISLGYVAAVAAAFLLPGAKWILPFVILYPLFEGGVSTCLWTMIPQAVPKPGQVSVAVALFALMSNLGMLVGPPVLGVVVERSGSWGCGALTVAAVMLLGVVLTSRIRLYQSVGESS